jgi:hypothetical protein
MDNTEIEEVNSHTHLGIYFNNKLLWQDQIKYLKTQAYKRQNILGSLKYKLTRAILQKIYLLYIRPILEYTDIVWDN